MSLSRSSGKMKLVENGKMFVNKPFAEVKASQPIKVRSLCYTYNCQNVIFQASIFTLGCYYRHDGSRFMSMYGSVTDAQVFSRELSDQEMVDMTTCK